MNDTTCLRTRKHRREWERAIRRFAKRAARQAGAELKASALLPLLVLVAAPGAFALPVGEQVQAGNVAINRPSATAMTITQGSQKGIVNWNGFSIQGNERVDISQPSAQAVLLNRVVGNEASRIAGQLNANGQVFLVNPAGVMFARGASVNVGSLVASTLGISDDAFLAGKYRFTQGGAAAGNVSIEPGAAITAAAGGAVALLGAQVDNSGRVSATLGKIAMGAGSDITLDFAGDGLTMLKVNDKVANALVSNAGVLEADGGQIVMSARAADEAAASVLNQTGTVRARSVEARNGRIVLDGGTSGVTEIAGNLDASAPNGGTGGRIDVTGHDVALMDGARIDASGAQGGGRVRVGGGAAGREADIANADGLWMSPNAHVFADALAAGDGGNVVMYATQAARVYGELSARGGAGGGNGGRVETSGGYLETDGAQIHVDAPMGRGGEWLLDPASLLIVNTRPSTLGTAVPALDPNTNRVTFSPGTADSSVLAQDVSNQLNSGSSVTLSTSSGGTGLFNGDITMQRGTSITKTGPAAANDATLTLSANGSITLLGTIGGASVAQAGGPSVPPNGRLNVVLDANTGNAPAGASRIVLAGASISTNGGFLTIGVPQAQAGTPAAATSFDGAAVGIASSLIDTTVPQGPSGLASGSVTINGQGALTIPNTSFGISDTFLGFVPNTPLAAVNVLDSSLATSVSDISIRGQAGNASPVALGGVSISGNSQFNTTSGNIDIRGVAQVVPTISTGLSTSLSTGVSGIGVALIPTTGSTVQSPSLVTQSGTVSIDGTAPDVTASTSVSGAGVRIEGATISTATGDVSVTGRAPAYSTNVLAGSSLVDGVDLAGTRLAAGGRMLVQGTVQPAPSAPVPFGVPGTGVSVTGNANTPTSITSANADIRIFGGGNALPGVSLQGDIGGGNVRRVDVRTTNGDIDIRGYTTNQPDDGVVFPGVQISDAYVTAQGNGRLLSITGQTPSTSPAIALNNSVISAGRDPDAYEISDTGGTLVLRATSGTNAPAPITITTSLSTVSPSLFAPGGNLVFVPGGLAPDTFDLVAQNATPINVGGTASGFTITPTVLGQISPNVLNVLAGSSTHTGPITLNTADPAPNAQSLTLANGGAGSEGISLPAGFSGNTLTLQSAGTVTEGGAGIQASTLNLVGPGVFNLTGAPNSVASLSFSGTRDVTMTNAGDIAIANPAGVTFDNATGRVVPPTAGANPTLAGSLDLRTTDGGESGTGDIFVPVPIVETASGASTLAFHSNGVLNLQNDITSTAGPLDIVADARNAIIALGNAGEGPAYRIRFATNGGRVAMGTANGGASGFDGATVQVHSTDIDTGGGNVTLHGIAPAQISTGDGVAFPAFGTAYGVDLNDATIRSGTGSIDVQGQSLNAAANPGGGVILRNAGNAANVNPGPTQLVSLAADSADPANGSAIRVFGAASGAGNNGVAMLDGASVQAPNGTVDVRGHATGANPGGYGALLWSGSIAAANVRVTGSTDSATPGLGIGAVNVPPNAGFAAPAFSIGAGASGAVILRSANGGTDSSIAVRSAPGSIAAPGGTIGIAPASVDPSSFAVTAQNDVPVTLFGTSATTGLSIDAESYQAFSPAIATLVLGSSTQNGRIVVEGACAGGAGCAARPAVATSLTLQNTGANSQGIDLPSGIALPGKTLALDSSGAVTDPGGIAAQTLLLAGGGNFALADAGNSVGLLALAGAHDVRFSNAGGFAIGAANANGLDGAAGSVAQIGGPPASVTGDLTAIADTGAIALGVPGAPTTLSAGGSIDLVMQQGLFQNDAGGTLNAGNAWRVWALSPNDERRNGVEPGGALPNFYGCLYGGVCSWNGQPSQNVVPASGNHFVYADRPVARVVIGDQARVEGTPNGPFTFDVTGLLGGDQRGSAIAGGVTGTSATTNSPPGRYAINGAFSSPVGYEVVVVPGTLTVTPMELQGAVFNRSGLQPLFTAQEQSFVYESNLGGVNICVGTNEPILALQQSEGPADTLAAEWKRVRSRPNLNNCLVVNGQHGCGEF
ncbi:filamentous hemagglutinin N-terminal domain-containing protein [Caballeronia sp. ATUFL_M2_KS44]|uniref:two-partner secretion domain-containing protein n=1 Tax=Caballeronia sp. ATUFL_M2_KS44 TaxID=2921767 RepID=UPI0020291645|nr:filamentous hemagglutinin N-terminal domain-containing protein [Caballeronia sp. ATUFL_M2_KS44]